MKIFLISLFLLNSYASKSQDYYEEPKVTIFDTFTNKLSITWAAYAYDTIRFNDPNLSDVLIKRMEKGEIKTAYPIYSDKIEYTTKKTNHQMFYHCNHGNYIYDSLGNIVRGGTPCLPDRVIDYRTFDLLWLRQIFYVENGKLKSYIPWVSPAFSAVLSTGELFFITAYFSTCINFKYNFIAAAKDKKIYIGQTKRRLVFDSTLETETIKKTYGRNLLQAIWGQVTSGRNEIYNSQTNTKILPKDINYFILSSKSENITIYDSIGNEIGTKYRNPNPIPYYITEVEIVQQWYYNSTKNIVTCEIPEIFLYVGKDDNNVAVKVDKPALKIIFK